jgi:hypothetical protein
VTRPRAADALPAFAPACRNCAGNARVHRLPRGDLQRDPPMQRARSLRWPPPEIGAGLGRVRQSGSGGGSVGRHSALSTAGAKRRKRLLFSPRSQNGPVDCVHQVRRPLLSSRERPSLQAPLRRHHLTLRHRRLTRSRRDRSRYRGQRSRQWSTTRRVVTCRNLRAWSPRACCATARFCLSC